MKRVKAWAIFSACVVAILVGSLWADAIESVKAPLFRVVSGVITTTRTLSVGGITSTGDISGVSGTFTGAVTMGTTYSLVPYTTAAGNLDLTTADNIVYCKNGYVEITAAGTVSLPAGAAGYALTVYATGTFAVSVDPAGAEVITLNGVDLAGGNKITSTSTSGDTVTLIFTGTKWRVIGMSAWTDGGA
ncbi:MAG: hypothetical protein WC241_04100 [Candidatus Paceibacterota bacterium]|jgi:hypothetical protein